ncbi:hypothetical protein FRB95_011049, partial [Tulasnella sp. JGI-2019a]
MLATTLTPFDFLPPHSIPPLTNQLPLITDRLMAHINRNATHSTLRLRDAQDAHALFQAMRQGHLQLIYTQLATSEQMFFAGPPPELISSPATNRTSVGVRTTIAQAQDITFDESDYLVLGGTEPDLSPSSSPLIRVQVTHCPNKFGPGIAERVQIGHHRSSASPLRLIATLMVVLMLYGQCIHAHILGASSTGTATLTVTEAPVPFTE